MNEDDGEKGTGDKEGVLLKSETTAWLIKARCHNREPNNWLPSITVDNLGGRGQKDRERQPEGDKNAGENIQRTTYEEQERYDKGMLSI